MCYEIFFRRRHFNETQHSITQVSRTLSLDIDGHSAQHGMSITSFTVHRRFQFPIVIQFPSGTPPGAFFPSYAHEEKMYVMKD